MLLYGPKPVGGAMSDFFVARERGEEEEDYYLRHLDLLSGIKGYKRIRKRWMGGRKLSKV